MITLIFCSNAGNALYSIPPACLNVQKIIGSRKHNEDKMNMKPVSALLDILRYHVMNVSLFFIYIFVVFINLTLQLSQQHNAVDRSVCFIDIRDNKIFGFINYDESLLSGWCYTCKD